MWSGERKEINTVKGKAKGPNIVQIKVQLMVQVKEKVLLKVQPKIHS